MPDYNEYQRLKSPFTDDFKLAPLFAQETEKPTQNRLFHLIRLQLPDPEPPLDIADSNFDVKFDGITYLKFPCKYSPADQNSDGSISKASIVVANVARDLMYYIEKYNGLRNCRISIKTVYENALDEKYFPQPDGSVIVEPNEGNNTAYIEDEYNIDTYSANEQTIAFQLDPIIDLEIRIPRRRYMVDGCYWKYKDAKTCKYPVNGALAGTTCGKTLAECRLRNNAENFGGFPGISGSRRIFL